MIVAIGTDDTLASPGSQMNYYQALLDRMGRASVDSFAAATIPPTATGNRFRRHRFPVHGIA
jgi:feruloyl esterase